MSAHHRHRRRVPAIRRGRAVAPRAGSSTAARRRRGPRPPAVGADGSGRPRQGNDGRAGRRPPCAAGPGSALPAHSGLPMDRSNGASSTATSMPATNVACLSSPSNPQGAQARSTSSAHNSGMSGNASRSKARRSVARTRSTTLRSSGRSLSEPPRIPGLRCGATELSPILTIDQGNSAVSTRARAPRL